jgi:hypothetical protein
MADYTTPLGQVRLLTADLDETNPLLSDEVLNGYLSLHTQDPYLAAADALDAMATSEVLLSRKIRTQDLSTDGPAVAAELRKQASYLRGKSLELAAAADPGFFEIVPLFTSAYSEGVERWLP